MFAQLRSLNRERIITFSIGNVGFVAVNMLLDLGVQMVYLGNRPRTNLKQESLASVSA